MKFKNTSNTRHKPHSVSYTSTPITNLSLIFLLLIAGTFDNHILVQAQSDSQAQDIISPYKTLSITSLDPQRGPTYGDTRVLVRGESSYEGLYQTYRTPANWVCLQCENNPPSPTNVSINVTFQISITGNFDDTKLPNQNFYSTFEYYPSPEITEIVPPYGQKDGTTIVTVYGRNFENYGNHTRCSFGTNTTEAFNVTSSSLKCISTFSDVVDRPMPFSISLNNQQFAPSNISYWYYNWPQIAELIPPKGPWFGGTNITLKGRNFKPFIDAEIDNTKDRYCMFDFDKNTDTKYHYNENTQRLVKTKAYIESSTIAYCVSPPVVDEIYTAFVEITLNDQEYTDDQRIFTYYQIPKLIDVNPKEGPVPGGTRLIAIGEGFQNQGNVTCKFTKSNSTGSWTRIVKGRVLTSAEIECFSPPADMPGYWDLAISLQTDVYSDPVKYLYYEMPVIYSIEPNSGPDYGYTQITLHGKNFWDLGSNKALCVFNKTIFTNATIMHSDIIKCDSPSLYDSQGYSKMGPKDSNFLFVEVTIDGGRYIGGPRQKFTFYKDPPHIDIVPSCGPVKGGTIVKIVGSGFNQTGASNKTARFATWELKPINETNDTTMFVTSPPVSTPDAVVVGVALNGQQFTRDLVLHYKDDENTFEYYVEPFVTSFGPKSGPSNGGTKIKISGQGFTPRKNKDGEVDKTKNKMYIRFVDPVTLAELAPPAQINPDDFSDDEITARSPALPPGTKALMQLSLNGQDWQSLPQPQKPYSFAVYDAPHIDILHPAFGPVKAKTQNYMYIEGRNFICPDVNCTNLKIRFNDALNNSIFVKGEWVNSTSVRCLIPKYTKPDELVVELTMNDQDYTNDGKKYGYFDPYVLNAEPRLISVEGTTKVMIKGFGFVNSSQTKSYFNNPTNQLNCQGVDCVKTAQFIDSHNLLTTTYPQTVVNYNNGDNILWDPMNLDAAVYENGFTDNSVQVWYYQEPDYQGISPDESPANIESPVFIKTDFKNNPIDRLAKYGNFTCRFKSADGTKVMYSKGEMVKYPLEQGKSVTPNNIQCKSPIWDLQDKSSEHVTLDVAVNGQDFKGGFDFLIAQELRLNRVLPMAGPVQGNTTSKLFGLGFKPLKGVADSKWGVYNTTEITKSLVQFCLYHQESDSSSDTCDELLKTEIYDDTRFPTMYEGKNYSTIQQQSPKVWNWTKTQGGPHFLEVGKNNSINYMTTLNQSIYQGNITVNGTSVAQYTNVQVPQMNTMVCYDYEPSPVYFYYYKDCVVKEIFPHSAKISGGTTIHVSGAWFKEMPWHGVTPHCKFGDKIVRGIFDSTVRIACIAPPGNEIGQKLPIEVSLNGVDFSNTGFNFAYYEQPILDRITPTSGKEQGGAPIYIIGKSNFTKMDDPSEFNCKFTPVSFNMPPRTVPAIYMNNTFIRCQQSGGWGKGGTIRVQITFNGQDYDDNNFLYTMFSVYKVFPRSGPYDTLEEEDVIIDGAGFISENIPACRMNGTIYNATQYNDTQIRCPIIRTNETQEGWVDFDVAPNGIDWAGIPGGFYYYSQPQVYTISPPQGPAKGKGIITFYGQGFQNNSNLQNVQCKIGNSIGYPVAISNDYLSCVVENIELTSPDEPLAAQVALNGYSWSYLNESTYYVPYGIEYISPNSGPETSNIDVYVYGKGFQTMYADSGNGNYYQTEPKCRFGSPDNNAVVDAQIISYDKLLCRLQVDFTLLPNSKYPLDVPFSIALSGNDSISPWTETSQKFRLYDNPNLISSEPNEVEIGTVTDVLIYADEVGGDFFDPILVNNSGNFQNPLMCQFGRFGQSEATYINEKVIKCRTPTVEDDPGSVYREEVQVTLAMNGRDFDESNSLVYFTFVGTGTYLVFWQILIVVLLIALIIAAIVVCISTLFKNLPVDMDQRHGSEGGQPHVFNIGGGLMIPRGRADWHAERSSVDILEKASGTNFS